mmetsp:Transcript_25229/g.71956  ORF Transcript_25229/g.71956 Transcript_25229/m.71956 type:complete len:123 (+) Transcript_25229:85-453(+)
MGSWPTSVPAHRMPIPPGPMLPHDCGIVAIIGGDAIAPQGMPLVPAHCAPKQGGDGPGAMAGTGGLPPPQQWPCCIGGGPIPGPPDGGGPDEVPNAGPAAPLGPPPPKHGNVPFPIGPPGDG